MWPASARGGSDRAAFFRQLDRRAPGVRQSRGGDAVARLREGTFEDGAGRCDVAAQRLEIAHAKSDVVETPPGGWRRGSWGGGRREVQVDVRVIHRRIAEPCP